MSEEFLLDIIAVLNEQVTKKKIKDGLKSMDNSMYVKVISKLSIALSQRQLKKDFKQLNDLYLQVGADLKIDSALKKKLQGRIKTLQDSISDLQIGVRAKDSNIAKTVTEARNKSQRVASRSSIDFNIEVKKEKAIADLEYMAKKYSKLFSNASASSKYNNILDAAYGITDAKQLSNVRAQIAAFTSELKANNLASQSLGDKWKRLIDRAKDLFSAASAVTLIFSQVKQAVSSFLQLDTAMTDLYKVQDQITSRDQFSGLLTKWNKLAQNLAVTTNSLISSMEAWSKIGFNLDMSEQLAEITSIFEKTAEISNEKATSTLISAAQAFTEIDDLGVDDYVKRVEAVGNKINAIGNKYAIDSEGIADGLQNASAALKVAGNDLNETIALITATNKIYQNPEEGSNMLKVAAARLRGQVDTLKEMGEDAEGVSTDLTKIQQQVYELTGNKVNIFEDDENLKSTYQMILEIGEVFDSLSDRSQADLLEVMFGKQRASAGASLLLNYEELEKIKNDSMNAANSMAEEYSKYMESAEAHITIFKEKLVETYSTFMSGDVIKYTADVGSGLLDLVNATDLLRHGLVGIVSLNIGKGITSIGASIAVTAKQFNMLGSALQQVKNLPVDNILKRKSLDEIGESTKNLTEHNLKLLLSQKKLEDNDKVTILTKHNLTKEEAQLKLEKMGLLSVTKSQTTANVAEAATTGTLKNAMLSLKATAKEVGVTIKGMFASNPMGVGLMLVTTAISMLSTAVSKHNEKLEESRRANIESATTASENADKLKDLYNEYTRLASIQDRTTSEEESFKTAVENITVALGDKAEILKDLTAGTDEYADALARVTKEELQSQAVTATIGRKASEEEFQGKIWSDWSGSQVTIDSNSKGKSLSDEAQKAVDIVSESLKEYETINRTWKNISWDISSDDPTEALEYYNSLVEAREKLVLASENDEALLDTEIYKDLNTAINTMSENLDTYIEKLYEEEKLNYMAQNGIPSVTEEYKSMESALVSAAGSSVDLQNRFKELLTSDFSDLATDIGNVGNAVNDASAQAQSTIPLFNQLASSEEELDKFQSSVKSATDAYSTLLSGNYSSTELLDSIQDINKAVKDMGGSINWESLDVLPNSLELLGNVIEHVSEEYAKSILSDAGIDVNSKFGQMLANNIIQAQKAGTQLEVLNDQIDSLQGAYNSLTDIVEAYNKTGYITFDQLQTLLEMEPQYLSCLMDENGQLQLNEAAMTELANQRLNDAEAQAVQQAITELGQLALQDEKTAVEENAQAFSNAVNDLAGYNTELANTIAEATVGASAIRDLNAAINGAESQGATDDQINTVLDNLNTKLQLIENVRDKVAAGGLSSVLKSDSGSKSGSSKDTWKEAYEEELKELERMYKLGLISDEEYWKARMDLNEKYFGESSGMHQKYLEEYQDNEEEILEGIKNLWKDYYDDRKNDLKDLISYAEKLYDKEIDSLEASIEKLEERRDTEKKFWQDQIDDIDAEIDALEDANDEKERAIDLQEKQYQLQKAMQQRTILLYSADKGFYYSHDDEAVRNAKKDLESAEHDNKIADLKKQQKELQKQLDIILESYDFQIEAIEKQIDSLKDVKSAWSEIAENQELKELEERLKSIFGDDVKDKILSGNTDFMNSIIEQYSDTSDMLRTIEDATLTDIQNMVAQYGVLPENLMSVTSAAANIMNALGNVDTSGFNTNLDNTAQSSSNAAEKVQGVTTALNDLSEDVSNYQMPEINGIISEEQTAFNNLKSKIDEVIEAINLKTEAIKEEQNAVGIATSSEMADFILLKDKILEVKETLESLDTQDEGFIGNIATAIQSLNEISLEDGIITQFTNLKTAIEQVVSAINGGNIESSGGKGQGGSSSQGSESGGKGSTGGNSNSLTGAITDIGTTASEVIGEPEAEGDSTVIGEFGSLETAVNDVASAIGGGDTEGSQGSGKGYSNNLIGSITNLGETTTETLGEPDGGDGVIGRFEEFENVINEADEHVHGISDGLNEIDGKEVECTIKVNVETNGNIPAHAEGTLGNMNLESGEYTARYGKAFAEGTGDSIWTTLADGTKIRPLQPGDKMYDLQQKFEAYFKSIDGNLEKLVPNSYYEQNRELSKLADQISYANSIVNNRNVQQPVINVGDVNVTCPGVTSQEVMREVGNALGKQIGHLALRAIQEPLHDY